MIKEILIRLWEIVSNRIVVLTAVIAAAFGVLLVSLYQVQIRDYEHYVEIQAENRYETVSIEGERGAVYDRYGRPLAINEESRILIYTPSAGNRDLNRALLDLMDMAEKNGDEIGASVVFPIGFTENGTCYYKPAFTSENEVAHGNFLAEVYNTSRDRLTDEQKNTSAQEAMRILAEEQFGIDPKLPAETYRELTELRYAIFSGRFDPSAPIRIGRSVSEKTEAEMVERAAEFSGFSVELVYTRVYPEGELFAHIIGYVGRIDEEEMAEAERAGRSYDEDAIVGKTGIEAEYESTLRGKQGTVRLEIDTLGDRIVDQVTMVPAEEGNSIFLTIDRDLQEAAYESLYQQIKTLLVKKITGKSGEHGESYSVQDILCALLANHFIPDSVLDNGSGYYMDIFREIYDDASESALLDLRTSILETKQPVSELSEEEKNLYDLLIEAMRDRGYLSYAYQDDEAFYPDYLAGKISPYDFFVYCLENGVLNLEAYEIYTAPNGMLAVGNHLMKDSQAITYILDLELQNLGEDPEFHEYLYRYLLQTGLVTEPFFFELLYEQGLLSDEDGSREMLVNDEITTVELLQTKIMADEITPADVNLDPCSGSVVITDPMSGEVLAMVSYPSYDPNRFMNSYEYYEEIIQDNSGPLSFRALSEMRAIGSTFKLLTSACALDLGVITKDTTVYDDYRFPHVNTESQPVCWSSVSHGEINVVQAIDYSCNYFFYQVGYWLSEPNEKGDFNDAVGLAKLRHYAELLGLAGKTGIELSETEPHPSELDAVRSAIGQGDGAYSCANLNRYTMTLVNGGNVYDLFLVNEIHSPDGAVLYRAEPVAKATHVISETNLRIVRDGMRLVVTDDHGEEFAVLEAMGIHCGGKTGTAQEMESRPDHSLFTGYASDQNPEVTISVMIPFGGGSRNAIPVFINILLNYDGISLDR